MDDGELGDHPSSSDRHKTRTDRESEKAKFSDLSGVHPIIDTLDIFRILNAFLSRL